MQYLELVEKVDAIAENLKKRLRDMETNFFEEDRKRLQSNDKLIVARIELSNDNVTFASFPYRLYAPSLPVDLSETHVCVAENGSMLFRLKTEMKSIEPFFVSSVDELPYEKIGSVFFWYRFEANFTPMRNRTEMYDYLYETVQKEFSFLNKEDKAFMNAIKDVMEYDVSENVSAREIAARINKPLNFSEITKSLREQIVDMFEC